MWIVELLVVLLFIWFGARLRSIGIGYAGGFGVLVLSLVFGLKPGYISFDIILIIMEVIAAIAAMQEAGGLDYNVFAGDLLASKPWMLAIVLFFAAMLLYSQAATAMALMPVALALGVGPMAAIAAFPFVSAQFVLPTFPTLLAAVEFDDTGSTRISEYVFDDPFLVPGVL